MSSQRSNPGGYLSPEQVIGRGSFVDMTWYILETQGLYITGERRIGKSSIFRDKMQDLPPAGMRLLYFDVADVATPSAFANRLFRKAKEASPARGKWQLGTLEVLGRLAPDLEFPSVVKLPKNIAPTWKEQLQAILAAYARSKTRVVLVFDEMAVMLDKIRRGSSDGNQLVMDMLDTMRQARQTHSNLRMVYMGSLGLHHILSELQKAGYQNAPLNDLRPVEVPPLTNEDAFLLASRVLNNRQASPIDAERAARHLAQVTNGIPYYIQYLAAELEFGNATVDPAAIDRLLTEQLTTLTDPWNVAYYKERIDTHYQTALQPIALDLLDQLAAATQPLTFAELINGINPQKLKADEATVDATLKLLGKDHYIVLEQNGGYRFRYPLIARIWTCKCSQKRRS